MADQYNPTLEYVDFPDLARGMSTDRPARSMTPSSDGPLFKLVQNMNANHGSLGTWYGIFPLAEFETNGYPTIERDGSYFETAPDGLLNGQCPVWMFFDYPQTWNNSTSTTQSTYGKFMGIVVTSREIYIYSPQNHVWYNATPVYSGDGAGRTVDVSVAGLVTINTGTSPWNTRKIVPGQLIQFAGDANWYSITSVLTGPDRLQTTFAGVAKVNVAYTIRRCFGGRNYSHGDNLLYGTVFNGDLYIAGRTLAGATVGPAVIRVNNIYDNVYTTEYLLAAYDLTGSMSTNGSVVANLWDIKGLQILPDGRVVIATAEVPSTMTGIVGNRLRYSSNTGNTAGTVSAQEQWAASPAGFIDVVDLPGEITALGKLGPSTLTIHFHRGISLGTYTAQYDPPIAIQSSAAKVGCFAPRTLVLFQGQEIFLGADGLVHKFNGQETEAIVDETIDLEHGGQAGGTSDNYQSSYWIANAHACVETKKNRYRLFLCDNNFEDVEVPPAAYADYKQSTTCWLIDLETGALFSEQYVPQLTAAAYPAIGLSAYTLGSVLPVQLGGNFGTFVVGTSTTNPADTVTVGGSMIYGMTGDLRAQNALPAAMTRGTEMALFNRRIGTLLQQYDAYAERPVAIFETDDLDFGNPGVDKTLDHVLIWFTGTTSVTSIVPTLEVSSDGGLNWSSGQTGWTAFAPGNDMPLRWSFAPVAKEKWRIRLTYDTAAAARTQATGIIVHRMRVYYQTQGEIEAANPDL